MLIIKNISKVFAISLIIIGFISGSFLPMANSSCCCGTTDNCCCCFTDDAESGNIDLASLRDKCSCKIEEADPPLIFSIEANNYTSPEHKVEKAEVLSHCKESLVSLNQTISIDLESIQNSGPPIYISVSSLLI